MKSGSAVLRLPTRVDEIDAAWLNDALRIWHPDIEVRSARIQSVMPGTATKIRVAVEYDARGRELGLPDSLIIKGGFGAHREMMAHIYEIEMRFFRDIARRLDVSVPRCFFAGNDPQNNQALVILEDLDLKRVEFCRVDRPLSYEQAAANLDAQARYHAKYWNHAALDDPNELGWVPVLDPLPDGAAGAYQHGQFEPATYAKYMDMPRGVAVPKIFHDRDRMHAAIVQLRSIDRQTPRALLHGDAHLGNMYFEADTPGFLDWQVVRQGPWSHDVTYFMISALDMLDRRRYERRLLQYYLDRLVAHGGPVLPREDAWRAYRAQIMYGLFFWLVNPTDFQTEVANCAVAARFAMAAVDHDLFA